MTDLATIFNGNFPVGLVDVRTQAILGPEVARTVLTLIHLHLMECFDVTLQSSNGTGDLTLRALVSQLQMFALLVSFQIAAVSKTCIAFITSVRLDVSVNLANMSP